MKYWTYIIVMTALLAAMLITGPAPAAADDNTGEIIVGTLATAYIGKLIYDGLSDKDKAKVEDLIETGKEYLGDWLVAGGNASLLDPNVRANLAAGDYEAAATLALPIVLNTMKNEATVALGDPLLVNEAVEAAWLVIQENDLIAAMITRPGGQGLYWRYLAWRIANGYSIAKDELWVKWPTGDDLDALLQVAIPAMLQEYRAAKDYLAAAPIPAGESDDLPIDAGLDTGAEVW